MKILVTGAAGAIGKNLVENLKNIRDGKNRSRPGLHIEEVFEYFHTSTQTELIDYCSQADVVFNLAGVNVAQSKVAYMAGNFVFASNLLDTLKRYRPHATVMQASSVQATLIGRYQNDYGRSKLGGEELFFAHAAATGAKVCVYRFPNVAGKWIRPDYNSAVATFCHNIAHDLPITVDEPSVPVELVFMDDLIEEMLDMLEGNEHRCIYPEQGMKVAGREYDGLTPLPGADGRYCYVPVTHKVTMGEVVGLLHTFRNQPNTLVMPAIPAGSFEKKLYSMYLSYLPRERTVFDLKMNSDDRGSFTELMKTADHGQFSVNISRPGITKGQHWHNTKWEFFIVVSGHGLIQQRRVGTDEIMEFEVSGEKIQAVHMLPGYTHNIINLSETENLVTLMWANEPFDPHHPDTFSEPV